MIKQMALSISLISYRFLGLFSLMFLIQNCSKDPGPCGGQKTYYYLSEEDKAKVPYTGTDTLVFVSNTNDTAVCIGQGKKQFFSVEYDSGNPDCKPPEYYYEAYNNNYVSTTASQLNFVVNIKKRNSQGVSNILDVEFEGDELGTIFEYLDTNYYTSRSINGVVKYGLLFYKDTTYKTTVFYNLNRGVLQLKKNDVIWNRLN